MFARRPPAVLVAAVAVLGLPGVAHAGFVSVTGAGNVLDPSATPAGAARNFFDDTGANKVVHGWNELQNVTLDRDVFVDCVNPGVYDFNSQLGGFNQYRIAKGTVVSSHLLYFDPLNESSVARVCFEFDAPIVGVIVSSDRFHDAAHNNADYLLDSDFLGHPDALYPATHYEDRGLELNQLDKIALSASGNRLTVYLTASTPGDQIRVITASNRQSPLQTVPAPPGIVLALAGGATIVLGRLVRRRRCPDAPAL
jgi:hypothetical protein